MNSETLGILAGQLLRNAFWATVSTVSFILTWSFIEWTVPEPDELNGSIVRLIWALSFLVAVCVSIFAGNEGEE